MKQYLKLLMAREAKEVLGKNGTNLWLLTLVLVATFTSIAFSEGSMNYLEDKMADPFTNWVSISKADADVTNDKFNLFREQLQMEENAERFDYRDVTMDQYLGLNIQGQKNGRIDYLSIRFFEHFRTPLVDKILDHNNVADGCRVDSTVLIDNTFGFIVTLDAIKKLGYDTQNLPAYIHYLSPISEEQAYDLNFDSLGLKPLNKDNKKGAKYLRVALPVLAVVRKLPNNMDMVSTNFFYEQYHYNHITEPFAVTVHKEDYLHHLVYWVSDEVGKEVFEQFVKEQATKDMDIDVYSEEESALAMKSWKSGKMLTVDIGGELQPIEMFNHVDEKIAGKWGENLVQRVYLLETQDCPSPRSDYLSVEFCSLNHIREFESFAKEYGISLEMEQVHSKENFNAVMDLISPYLIKGLRSTDSPDICKSSVYCLSDIIRGLGANNKYVNDYLPLIMNILSNNQIDRNLKPQCFNIISDIYITCPNEAFKSFQNIMKIMGDAIQATMIKIDENTEIDNINHFIDLREHILENLTCIFSAVKEIDRTKDFIPFVKCIVKYINTIVDDCANSVAIMKIGRAHV